MKLNPGEKVADFQCLTVVMKRHMVKLKKENGRQWPMKMYFDYLLLNSCLSEMTI